MVRTCQERYYAILHLDEFAGITSITELYHQCHSNSYLSTRIKGDSTVNKALDSKLNREGNWTRKGSTVFRSQENCEALVVSDHTENISKIKTHVKQNIHKDFQSKHHDHMSNLISQGEYLRLWEILDVDFNWKADIYGLPRGVSKFLFNSILTSLPTKDNLRKWGKVLSAACDLCGEYETVGHVLSGCKTMLDQGRYTWRHDSVLNLVNNFIPVTQLPNITIYTDLGDQSWTIPPDLLPTSDRPDLVVIDYTGKTISILELTVPFERNISTDHQYKCHKYAHLMIDLQRLGYSVKYYAIEIGCRAMISEANNRRLHAFYKSIPGFKFTNRDFTKLKKSICKTVITASFVIFKSKHFKLWRSPNSYCSVL